MSVQADRNDWALWTIDESVCLIWLLIIFRQKRAYRAVAPRLHWAEAPPPRPLHPRARVAPGVPSATTSLRHRPLSNWSWRRVPKSLFSKRRTLLATPSGGRWSAQMAARVGCCVLPLSGARPWGCGAHLFSRQALSRQPTLRTPGKITRRRNRPAPQRHRTARMVPKSPSWAPVWLRMRLRRPRRWSSR